MAKSEERKSEGKVRDKWALETITVKELPVSPNSNPIQEIFVDGFKGVLHRDGIVKIHFFTDMLNVPKQKIEREIAVRLVMSTTALANINDALTKIVDQYRDSGIVPKKKAEGEAKED